MVMIFLPEGAVSAMGQAKRSATSCCISSCVSAFPGLMAIWRASEAQRLCERLLKRCMTAPL